MKATEILLLDIGNSRIKWALYEQGRICEGAAFSYKCESVEALFDDCWAKFKNISKVIVSNVGGVQIAQSLKGWCLKRQLSSDFIQPQKQAYGLTNGYAQPLQLGVDRWVCLVAARAMYKGAVCVIDCGTAVTIDVLNEEGEHLGGMISPGLQLMKQSLLKNTSEITEAGNNANGFLGQCTADAVQNGAIHSVVGLVERTLQKLEREQNKTFLPVLTGGDAQLIKEQLSCDVKLISDLALKGLVVIAEGREK